MSEKEVITLKGSEHYKFKMGQKVYVRGLGPKARKESGFIIKARESHTTQCIFSDTLEPYASVRNIYSDGGCGYTGEECLSIHEKEEED